MYWTTLGVIKFICQALVMSPAGVASNTERGGLDISLSLPAKGECSLVGTRKGQDPE